MSEPAFTVVIPAYNERELVGGAIRSVQGQTRSDWELIVVDDGSVDDTAEVAKAAAGGDPRVQVISKQNGGLSAARNTAIEASEAPLLSFLDSDDLWLPGYLEAMHSALEADPGAAVAYTDAWAMDAETNRFRWRTAMSSCRPPDVMPGDPEEIMKLLVRQNFIWVSTTIRRDVLVEAGCFAEDFKLAEDIELWFRILKLGYRIVRAPGGVLGIKRERVGAMSAQELGNLATLERLMGMVTADEAMPRAVRERAAARIDELERMQRTVTGDRRIAGLALRAKRRLGAARRATVGRRRDWRSEPPPPVREAFPDLDGLRAVR